MTITITPNGEFRNDQTSGIQNGGALGKDDYALETNLDQLVDPLENFLESSLGVAIPSALLANAADYEFGHAAGAPNLGGALTPFFVNVATTAGETVNDLFFSQSDGTLFGGQTATFNGSDIHVTGSTDPIHLYSFLGGDLLIGSTEALADVTLGDASTFDGSKLVFAYYLQENATHTGADVWGATFQPLDHPIFGDNALGEHDDAIDLGDFLNVTAQGSLSFEFDTLKSGNFLWVAVGTDTAGLLATGKDLNVNEPGTNPASKVGQYVSGGNDPSDTMNTSQGGQGATMGVNNQMFVPGATAVFTIVDGFTALGSGPDATGKDVDDIQYDGYINTDGAGLFISQTQGQGPVNLTIKAYEAGGGTTAEEGAAYIGAEGGNNGTSGAFEDDTAIGVDTVTIFDETNTLIGTWVDGQASDGTTQDGVTVNITGNSIDVDGIFAQYTVHWTADAVDGTFNRFQLTADAGSTAFDVGRVDVDKGVTQPQNIGEAVLIHDDGPAITAQIAGGVVEFLNGESVTNSLNGAIGTDKNDANNESEDGTKTYTITSFTVPTDAVPDLKGQLVDDDTKVVYFTDGAGGTAGEYDDGVDTLFYDLTLNQTANAGAGSYTFNVHQDVVPQRIEFDFTDLPSNQSLFGLIAADKTVLDGAGIAIVPLDAVLKADGTYSNDSMTINTSKGGGAVTIGVKNQMFDPGEGAYFAYITDPDDDVVAGVGTGLSTKYDDADNFGFDGTKPVSTASFEIVQNDTGTTARVTAYDIDPGRVDNPTTDVTAPDARDFILDPTTTDTLVNVTHIRVFDEAGNLLESVDNVGGSAVLSDGDGDGVIDSDGTVSVAFHLESAGIYSADVSVTAHNSHYTVEFDTEAPHDMALISGVAGKFDIGGFNLAEGADTPDQFFDFSVKITDGDLDTDGGPDDAFANFSVEVDGTGAFDNSAPLTTLQASSLSTLDEDVWTSRSHAAPGDYLLV